MKKRARAKEDFGALYRRLEALAASFDDERLDVEDGLRKFEEGIALAETLKGRLAEIDLRVERLRKRFDALRKDAGDDTDAAA